MSGFCILGGLERIHCMSDDKVFHSFDELVERLTSRGVEVDCQTKTVLKRESYYAVVNGYRDLFIDKSATNDAGDDRFLPGTAFDEIYRLHQLDRSLRTLFLPALLVAETTLKTLTVHVFCEAFPARDSYLDPSNFDLRSKYKKQVCELIESLEHALDVKSGRHKKAFIDHYLSKHKHVPLWVLANFLTFGTISQFFSLMRESTQSAMCREFSIYLREAGGPSIRLEPYKMRHLFRHLADFRNVCAHEERLYCAQLGKVGDVRVRTMVEDLQKVLPISEYDRLMTSMVKLIEAAAPGFSAISIDAVLSEMGFVSLGDVRSFITSQPADSQDESASRGSS